MTPGDNQADPEADVHADCLHCFAEWGRNRKCPEHGDDAPAARHLATITAERDAALAEVERLKADVEQWHGDYVAAQDLYNLAHKKKEAAELERDAARTEVERLKEKLRVEILCRQGKVSELMAEIGRHLYAIGRYQSEAAEARRERDESRVSLNLEIEAHRRCRTKYAQEVREEEREACARVAEEAGCLSPQCGECADYQTIAAAIRARGGGQ